MPLRTTSPALAATVMRLASTSALRRKASSILRSISLATTRGLSSIELVIPLTPFTRALGSYPLELPLNLAFERDPTFANYELELLGTVGSRFLIAATASCAISGSGR